MSAPQIPEEAKRAAHDTYCAEPDCDHRYDEVLGNILTAALPHLHKAWLEELIEKAETEKYPDTYGAFRRAARFHIVEWLRAELAEEGDGE